ncbi:hypothetical protein DPX16_12710 [Anabarilius grahami]|uniref:Uncharacterized protein n=1 Tax=Anabarilius grahami TaxID=495550 RepID=A0A3N0XTH1_ANAGA|nr:hypothetical protein DPX16_12710 [Anabarilius grahami]
METVGFVPNEKGRLQIHFKLIRFASYLVFFLINKPVSRLEATHTAKGLRSGSAAEVSRLPERIRETDPYRRPLAHSDGSATKADRGPAVAPRCIHD